MPLYVCDTHIFRWIWNMCVPHQRHCCTNERTVSRLTCRCCSTMWRLSRRSSSLSWRRCRSTSAPAPGLTTATPSSSCLSPCITSCLKVRKILFYHMSSVPFFLWKDELLKFKTTPFCERLCLWCLCCPQQNKRGRVVFHWWSCLCILK